MNNTTLGHVKQILKVIEACYPKSPPPTEQQAAVWFSMLQDLDPEMLMKSVQLCCKTQKFPPSVAEIIEANQKLTTDDWDEAWGLMQMAIRNYGIYNAENAKKYVLSKNKYAWATAEKIGFRTMCMMQSSDANTMRAQFRDAYKMIIARKVVKKVKNDTKALDGKVVNLIDKIGNS